MLAKHQWPYKSDKINEGLNSSQQVDEVDKESIEHLCYFDIHCVVCIQLLIIGQDGITSQLFLSITTIMVIMVVGSTNAHVYQGKVQALEVWT